MSSLFTVQYWFNQRPEVFITSVNRIFIIIIALFFTVFLTLLIFQKRAGFYKKLFGKLASFFITNALIGAVLLFFNHELIPFLSARFWLLLWLAGMIVWAVFIGNYVKKLPWQKKQIEAEKQFKKYIP